LRVLVTRALEDARLTARELARRGHEALLAPLSKIRVLDTEEPDLADVQAVIATSSNGIRAFAGRCWRKDIRVFAVGGNTAATARSAGFTQVSSAEGDSSVLAAAVCGALRPDAGALLHVTGKNRSTEMHRELAEAGFECRVWELYDVIACRRLPEQVITAFRTDAVDAVLVFSPESGRILVEALETGGVMPKCDRVVACCISKAAAVRIRDVEFGAIRIAENPTLHAVLALLDIRPGSAE
jgi:uroporphyrinogen-III synthase